MKTLILSALLLALAQCVVAQNSHIQVVAESGISIFLDGQFKGVTSSDYGGLIIQNVSSGQHLIKVVKEGYIPREATLNVKIGEVLMYQIDKNFIPAIKITEEGNKEEQDISIKKGNLTIQSLPISISISIPGVGVNYVKQEDKFHAENIPEGTYLAQFRWNEKVLFDSIKILNEMVTYLFVNMVELRIENKNFKLINENAEEITLSQFMFGDTIPSFYTEPAKPAAREEAQLFDLHPEGKHKKASTWILEFIIIIGGLLALGTLLGGE